MRVCACIGSNIKAPVRLTLDLHHGCYSSYPTSDDQAKAALTKLLSLYPSPGRTLGKRNSTISRLSRDPSAHLLAIRTAVLPIYLSHFDIVSFSKLW